MRDRRQKKALGQHFLTRPEVCAPLVEFLAPDARFVIEVGPGAGALTEALLAHGARIAAWELDPGWAFYVRRRFADTDAGSTRVSLTRGRVSIVVGDALEISWERLPLGALVAGNLPYNVATRIVLAVLESAVTRAGRIDRAAFLLQREVAERLAAAPGSRAYGSLSVLVASLARVHRLGSVAPGAFRPAPKVDSAFVGLTPRASMPAPARYARFKELVRGAFAQRRKTLRNSLASSLGSERTEALLPAAGLAPSSRAESLAPEDFWTLVEHWERLESTDPEGSPGEVE